MSIAKRFASIDVADNEENRRRYRELIITTPNLSNYISGAILFDETFHQEMSTGMLFRDYMNSIGYDNIESYEKNLLEYATESLKKISGLKIYGDIEEKISVISFNVGNHHPSDIGSILDQFGIAVRTGQHCTQPIMDRFNIPGTVRASFSFYNTISEIDLFVDAVKKASKMLG